ncbi:MAG: hypothetical protein U0531_18975 [Dehalococcoidia bacterium]
MPMSPGRPMPSSRSSATRTPFTVAEMTPPMQDSSTRLICRPPEAAAPGADGAGRRHAVLDAGQCRQTDIGMHAQRGLRAAVLRAIAAATEPEVAPRAPFSRASTPTVTSTVATASDTLATPAAAPGRSITY